MAAGGDSRPTLAPTGLIAAGPLYPLVTYRHCRGPGEGGAVALAGAADACTPTGPIAIVRAPATTLAVGVCYALSTVIAFSLQR